MSAEDLSDSNNLLATFCDPKMGNEKAVSTYSAFADQYNKLMADYTYGGPEAAAEAITTRFQTVTDKSQIRIIDIACGTGLLAEKLKKRGFQNIDGVDPSEGMLNIANGKGLYRNTWSAYVGTGKQLPIEDNTYDALCLVGSMGGNMLPCESIHELIRLVKPGGIIVNVFREEILTLYEEYRGRLIPLIQRLEQEGKWKQVSLSKIQYLVDKAGLVYVHQVL